MRKLINNIIFLNNINLYNGGYMRRLFRMSTLLVLLCIMGFSASYAAEKPKAHIGGEIASHEVRVFVKDTVYQVHKQLNIHGTLIVEPGTLVNFAPNSRIIVSRGGRLIADGFASAHYTAKPGGQDPMPASNTIGWIGYADLNYFLFDGTIETGATKEEKTINKAKEDYVLNVVLDKNTRQLVSGANFDGKKYVLGADQVSVPYQKAIFYSLAGLADVKNLDNDVRNNTSWKRPNESTDMQVEAAPIRFEGLSVNNFTRERGHIIVLPGARAAYFRNCVFENMRKDTTVDYVDYYDNTMPNASEVNKAMLKLTNGKGGAITTFSSRTWLVDCQFRNNFARTAAGALQVLQSPEGFELADAKYNALALYPAEKNPNLTNMDGTPSMYNQELKRIDNLDEEFVNEPDLTDYERQAYDDARLSMFLGRMRNLRFDNNKAILSNVKLLAHGTTPVVEDDMNTAADYPQSKAEDRDFTKGGAVLIAGRDNHIDKNLIEVGLGVNRNIKIYDNAGQLVDVELVPNDVVTFNGNEVKNYQNNIGTWGSMGGAIYLGGNTSLIVTGKFTSNSAFNPFTTEADVSVRSGDLARGGAIFQENTMGRIQVRGFYADKDLNAKTVFENNSAANGGAIFVDGNRDLTQSPIIGGSDATILTRNYGYDIEFKKNSAEISGGAIYTERAMRINGDGGLTSLAAGTVALMDNTRRIEFEENRAGISGGAVAVVFPFKERSQIPDKNRTIHFARAIFNKNAVDGDVKAYNKKFIVGGGAVYTETADLNVVKAVEFVANSVKNGNGGAIQMAHPISFKNRFFVSDIDEIIYNADGVATGYNSIDAPFVFEKNTANADARLLTRFLDNTVTWDADMLESQSGSGATQVTTGTLTTSADIKDIEFIDSENGFAVGAFGTIIKLSNAGAVWEYKNYTDNRYRFTSVDFTTEDIGFIAGDRGLILKTVDGGENWKVVNQPTLSFDLNSIKFTNSEIGYAVGQMGKILRSEDGGETWTEIYTGTQNHLYDVDFVSKEIGIAVGSRGTILTTNNGGLEWNILNANTTNDLNSIYFTDATTGYIAGEGVIFKTVNRGATWSNVYNDNNKYFKAITFTSLNDGYAYGMSGVAVKTNNAGASWEAVEVVADGKRAYNTFNAVHFPKNNIAILAADGGMMLRSKDAGATWTNILPYDEAFVDVKRYHPATGVRENGIGLGGAIYVLDSISTRQDKEDLVMFNRVRFQNNEAYSGAAIYSDNYNLKLVATRSFVTGNVAHSEIGANQNHITGPVLDKDNNRVIDANIASSDLAGAIIYGELVGPEPYADGSWAANSFYDNNARFLIRLPDAPNTKGALSGRRPGPGGVDTLRSNYWGRTEADVTLFIHNLQNQQGVTKYANMETFFVEKADKTYLSYKFGAEASADTLAQGPFERNGTFTTLTEGEQIKKWQYVPVALRNVSVEDENTADENTIPERFLMSHKVYDLYDKGTDIKVADYSNRRMSPIEDFAVGIPPVIKSHADTLHPNKETYLRRWTRDPIAVESGKYPMLAALQSEWMPDMDKRDDATKGYYHPIGYPLFLETEVNYDGDENVSNRDLRALNESVFFVINTTTGDFIRTNLKQVNDTTNMEKIFRARVELVPDVTKRNPQTIVRRSAEKLLSLGVDDVLLTALKHNPVNEDRATLRGRKYYGPHTQMGGDYKGPAVATGINELYINRDNWAPSNLNTATYWAGEKYQALPVDTGDIVRVISRTVLWKEGVIAAFDKGISFRISKSSLPPVFTGDIVRLQNKKFNVKQRNDEEPSKIDEIEVTEFQNTVWVTEDRNYPVKDGTYSRLDNRQIRGNDSILAVTAIDRNKFYDPRSVDSEWSNYYASLHYTMETPENSGVSKWLRYNIIPVGNLAKPEVKDEAHGYMVLKGTPMNPYVVPGGEDVTVKATNFAPSKRTIDLLGNIWAQDTLDKFIYIFPPYFHAPNYDLGEDVRRARYLQQDTINNADLTTAEYKFKLFVADSTPRFISYNANPVVSYKDLNFIPVKDVKPLYQDTNAVRVMVLPSVYRNGFCTTTEDGKLIASLTDRLRFQVDFNTDDEAEDFWAAKDGWDFKYGKTSYGFHNISMRDNPEDTTVLEIRNAVRPVWMADNYVFKYNSETENDRVLADYTSQGKLNVRIPRDEAIRILGVEGGVNRALNLDTTFTVVANDGHSGMTAMPVEVYINVAPSITNEDALPEAMENVDYNPGLIDTNKMVKVYDPNFDQFHRFELIYPNDIRTRIPKDPCFSEAGFWDITDLKTTPTWLKINPQTGLLYGTPTIKDNIRPNTDEKVVVLVWDRIKQAGTKAKMNAIKSNGTSLFAVGEKGTIIKVDKEGGSWEFVKVAGTEAFNLNDITFVDANNGYIVGNNGLILKTTDAGTTWNIVNTTYKVYNLNSVDFKDVANGVVAGANGNIMITNDGGATWKEAKEINKDYTNKYTINKVKFMGADKYLVAGSNGFAKLMTEDASNFTNVTPDMTETIVDVYQISASNFVLATTNSIYTSTDNGSTWEKTQATTTNANQFTSVGYYEVNDDAGFEGTKANIVYATGKQGTLFLSKDAGKTFYKSNENRVNSIYRLKFNNEDVTKDINDIVMTDMNNGFIVGNEGMIAKVVRTLDVVDQTDAMGATVSDTTVVINPTVITTREFDMLSDLKEFSIRVKRAENAPVITGLVKPGCWDVNAPNFQDTLYVMDNDLLRPESDEEVKLTVIEPASANWEIVKSTITPEDAFDNGKAKSKIQFVLKFNGKLSELGVDKRFVVKVQATDKSGNTTVYEVSYRSSLTPDFISEITIANNNGDSQLLEWGTAPNTNEEPVTTGDGNDNAVYGELDENYCEYEIAPTPDKKIFDARWIIPTRTGTHRNIQPRAVSGQACQRVFKNTFQTGGNVDNAGTGNYVPVKISWDKSKVPARTDQTINPAGSTFFLVDGTSGGKYFSIDMTTGQGTTMGDAQLAVNGDIVILTLPTVAVQGFNVIMDCTGNSSGKAANQSAIVNVVPSIVTESAEVKYSVVDYGTVTIQLFDALGNLVKTIYSQSGFPTNESSVRFDATDAAGNQIVNGNYTIKMTAGSNVSTYHIKVIK